MRVRFASIAVAVALLAGACSDAPDPGDLATFCSLLETGAVLSPNATETDYEQIALVAPPEIRPTIDTLRTRAGDFDELLALDPPDLEALFNARFDPAAAQERATLDAYAESSCGMVVNRPPSTRWNNYLRQNHPDALWRDAITSQFEVSDDRIVGATTVFAESPERITLVEDVCDAVSDFLIADGSEDASVQVLIGTVVVLSYDSTDGDCQLP